MKKVGKNMEELPTWYELDDPISIIADLNQEMLERMPKFEYIVTYSFWAGVGLAVLSFIGIVYVSIWDPDIMMIIFLISVFGCSVLAAWLSRQQRPFLYEYHLFSSTVKRGLEWEPDPEIPEGKDDIDSLFNYLREQDDRVGRVYGKKHTKLDRDHKIEGDSKKEHHFDLYLEGWVPGFNPFNEGIMLFIRKVPKVGK